MSTPIENIERIRAEYAGSRAQGFRHQATLRLAASRRRRWALKWTSRKWPLCWHSKLSRPMCPSLE
jgi:hypothetical protein